jgi:hypothetical protein
VAIEEEDIRLTQSAAGAEGTCLDPTDDVGSQLVLDEVVDEGACAGIVRANDGAEESLDLV